MTEGQQATLKALILRGPDLERDGASAWRIVDLCRMAEERFGVAYRKGGMLRLVKSLGLSWQKTRHRHPLTDTRRSGASKKGVSQPR